MPRQIRYTIQCKETTSVIPHLLYALLGKNMDNNNCKATYANCI